MDRNDKKALKETVKVLKRSEKIYIFPHLNGDGDAIGGAFGIAFVLKDLGADVTVWLSEMPGDDLKFLLKDGIRYKIIDDTDTFLPNEKYDTALCIDCSDEKRLGERLPLLKNAGTVLKVDHHVSEDDFGDVNYTDSTWSATCEGLYLIAEELGYDFRKAENGRNAAISFYTGLLTDSGRFTYSNTTSRTHIIAGKLMETTGDMSEVARSIFSLKSFSKVKMFGKAYERAEKLCGGEFIFTYVTEKDMEEAEASIPDTDGISSELCAVKGALVSAFVRPGNDGEGTYKVSMRSYKYCDVAKIARAFGGGGHVRAAGFDFRGDFDELKKLITEEVSKGIEQGRNTDNK